MPKPVHAAPRLEPGGAGEGGAFGRGFGDRVAGGQEDRAAGGGVVVGERLVVDGGAEEAREADGLGLGFHGFERAPEDLGPDVDAEGGLERGPVGGGVRWCR